MFGLGSEYAIVHEGQPGDDVMKIKVIRIYDQQEMEAIEFFKILARQYVDHYAKDTPMTEKAKQDRIDLVWRVIALLDMSCKGTAPGIISAFSLIGAEIERKFDSPSG